MIAKKVPNPTDKHVGSRVRMRRMMLFLECDVGSQGLTLVALLHSGVSAMLRMTRAPPYGMGGVARVRFQGAGIVVPSALE